MRIPRAARVAAQLALIAVALTVAFYGTAFVYHRAGVHPPGPLALIVNTLCGAFFAALAIVAAEHLFGPGPNHLLSVVTVALQRIGAGDFSTRLNPQNHSRVGGLVNTVNQVALQLDEWETTRQEFVSDVSHEIQSPLTSIAGLASALKQDDLNSADRLRYLEIIETETQRLSRLAASLLELASLHSVRYRCNLQPYRLDTQLREVILNCETQWSRKRLEMEAVLPKVTIVGDQELLNRLWINLLDNSIKFTPEGGEICVKLCSGPSHLRVTVADSGIGIAAADLPRIFERFYKADKARTALQSGNGLGLSIAKRVVDLHGGTITAQSLPGRGAEFVVELPLARSTHPA